jgi:hypothetical protein
VYNIVFVAPESEEIPPLAPASRGLVSRQDQDMASEVDQIFFNRAQWRLALLIPGWLLSLAMSLSLMGIFAYRLAETIETWEDSGKKGNLPQVELT